MGYFDYTKEKDFLICIDSDGCAMDTMNSKHFNSFGPEFVKSYDLEEYKEEALEYLAPLVSEIPDIISASPMPSFKVFNK